MTNSMCSPNCKNANESRIHFAYVSQLCAVVSFDSPTCSENPHQLKSYVKVLTIRCLLFSVLPQPLCLILTLWACL